MWSGTRAAVLLGTLVAALAAAAPPDESVRALQVTASSSDPFAPLVALCALLAWVAALWVGLTGVLTLGSRLPGAAGRAAGVVLTRVAPATLRRAVELALGISLAAGVAGASPAVAAPVSVAALVQAPSLDWPTPSRPAAAPTPAAPAQVVVAPGDTLWSLAARALGPAATDRAVAAAWPAWWAANRDVLGDDPHVLRPGLRLTPPAY